MITIDYREHAVMKLLDQGLYKTENLVHGDFLIGEFVIERKTIPDLCSSIKDGRFREQKSRLMSVFPPGNIVYIIEGYKTGKHSLPDTTIRSAILNLTFKHNFKVVHSRSTADTVAILLDIQTKVTEGLGFSTSPVMNVEVKKSSASLNNALACQLATIPGVSMAAALVVQEKYSTTSALLDAMLGAPELLSELPVSDKRKFGPKLSNKVFTAFFGENSNLPLN